MASSKIPLILFALAWSPLVAMAQMPPNGHLPPCGPKEVTDEVCLSYLTLPDGSQMCAPDGMKTVCLPQVTGPGESQTSDVFRCRKDGRVCVDATPVKIINTVPVTLEMVGGCWQYRRDYTCTTNTVENTCQKFEENESCNVYGRKCISQAGIFGCSEWEVEYRCVTKPGRTDQVEFCGDRNICIGGVCWDTGYPPDPDFAQVITDMETVRQIGTYSPNGLDIFHGEAAVCRSKRAAGLKNCCTTDTSARSNNAVMGEFISGAGGFMARAGSKYMFDTLYGDTTNWLASGWSAAIGANLPGGQSFLDSFANPGFGMYGFSIGGTGSFLGTSGFELVAANSGGYPVYFNPYAFAFAISMHVVMQAMTCDEEEAKLAMKRGAGLCSDKIGDWCTKKVLGVCITRKRSYCCYNSKLAKIINVQGRAQLGIGWGDEESPSCSGFDIAQLKAIDFSKIDFSEFVGDVMAAVDTSHLQQDLLNAKGGGFQEDSLTAACRKTYEAVGGDMSKLPGECEGLI